MDRAEDALPGRRGSLHVGGTGPKTLDPQGLLDVILPDAERAYSVREAEVDAFAGEGAMRRLERGVVLDVIDRRWRNHLYEMDYLREGIGLRAIAQRDPVVEYRREGYDMFVGMLEGAKEECVERLFSTVVQAAPAPLA